MSITYSINGFVLENRTQANGIFLLEGTEYAPAVSPRRSTVEIPGVHYAVPQWNNPLSAITVNLSLRLQATSPEGLQDYWHMVSGMLGMGSGLPVELSRIRGNTVETAEAELVSTSAPDFSHVRNRLDVQVVFSIPRGAWRGEETDEDISPGSNVSSSIVESSSRPITDALIRAPGPVGLLEILDNISRTGLEWSKGSLVVPEGGFLLVETETLTARIVDTDTWDMSEGEPASGRLAFVGYGPLALTSRWVGGEPSSSISLTLTESPGPLTLRSSSAVI